MPDHHLYASSNWVRDKTDKDTGPGEVTSVQKKFLTGRNPPFYLGQCRVGSDEVWQKGLSIKAMLEPAEELPECCTLVPPPFVGLSAVGAVTFLFYNVPPPAPPSLQRVSFTLSGLGDQDATNCTNLNRAYVLQQTAPGGTNYIQTDTVFFDGLNRTFSLGKVAGLDRWIMNLGTPPVMAYQYVGHWDQRSPLVLTATQAAFLCFGTPLNVTVTPL